MHTEQALAISGMPSILTPAGGLRTEGMGDGWMIRGTDAEKEARIPALSGMPALPALGSLALRSLCPRCYTPLLWTSATHGIPWSGAHWHQYPSPHEPRLYSTGFSSHQWFFTAASLKFRALMHPQVCSLPRQERGAGNLGHSCSCEPVPIRAGSCVLSLFCFQARNVSLGHHGGSFLLLFSSIASSNDNSTIHLLVKHLK